MGNLLGFRKVKGNAVPEPDDLLKEGGILLYSLVAQVVRDYLHEHSFRRKKSQWRIEATIGDYLVFHKLGGNATMKLTFTKTKLVEFKRALQQQPITPASVNAKLSYIAHFLKWCKSHGYMEGELPTDGLLLPHRLVKQHRTIKTAFSLEQLRLLLNHPLLVERRTSKNANSREYYWVFMLLAFMGARMSEITQLLTSDVRQSAEGAN